MFSTDQSHFRRYLATLGVAIAAATLSLAGLFLRLEQDLLVTKPTLGKLTATARGALLRRQEYLAIATDILPFFVLIGFVGGVSLTIYGMVGWARRQRIADEREDIELRKGRVELIRMTDGEQADRVDQEAKNSEAESSSGPPVGEPVLSDFDLDMPDFRKSRTSERSLSDRRTEVALLKHSLRQKLATIYADDFVAGIRVQTGANQAIEVDAIVDPKSENNRIVIELKYASVSNNVTNRIVDGLLQVARAASAIRGRGVLVVVIPDSATSANVESWMKTANDLASEYTSQIDVLIVRYSDFLTMPADGFAKRVNLY